MKKPWAQQEIRRIVPVRTEASLVAGRNSAFNRHDDNRLGIAMQDYDIRLYDPRSGLLTLAFTGGYRNDACAIEAAQRYGQGRAIVEIWMQGFLRFRTAETALATPA